MDWRRVLLVLAAALAACSEAPPPTSAPTAGLLPLPLSTGTGPAPPRTTPRPAVTPVILASPTVTATPVTHVVQAGETMLGIAITYGVSLEALQAANPGVEARFLSIGTVLIIPPPEGGFAAAATQLAPPPPAPVELTQPVCYPLPTQALYCLVDAHNPNQQPVANISARIVLAGADGLPFASQTAFAALGLIPPAGNVPLAALFALPPNRTLAATGVELLTANLAEEPLPAGTRLMLSVSADPGAVLDGRWTVSGHVTNPTTQPLPLAWVLLSLYDSQGQLIGFSLLALENGLAAGETRPFTIAGDWLAGTVDHARLLAEGQP